MTTNERRIEAFRALIARHGQAADDYDEGEEEDPRPYLSGETPLAPWICVTVNYSSHGEAKYFFLPFEDREEAQDRAVEYATDDIFEELPIAVVNLDTGEEYEPNTRAAIIWKKFGTPPLTAPVVVTLRDPDASNEYRVFGGDVDIHDIDAGYADLSDPEEGGEWRESHLEAAQHYEDAGRADVAAYIRDIVNSYVPEED